MQFALHDQGGLTVPTTDEASFGSSDPDEGIVSRLLRRKWLFASVFTGVLGLVGGAYFMISPTFKAEATVTVAAPDQLLASQQTSGGAQMTIGDTADLETQSAILSSPMVLRAALNRPSIKAALMAECELARPAAWKVVIKELLHVRPPQSCVTQIEDIAGMVDVLRTTVSVSVAGRSRMLVLAYDAHSPDIAKTVADGIVQTYLDLGMREKLQPREKAIDWLNDETKRVSDRLKETEARVQSFLQQQGVIRGQTASLASEQLTGLAQQINLAEAERAAASGRMLQVERSGGATSGVLGNRTVADVKMQLATVSAQIAQLSARYGDANPALLELLEQRQALMRMVGQETVTVNRSAAADYQAADSRVTALRQQLEGLKGEVRSNDNAATQVAALERQAATDRELYIDLTKSLNQLQTNMRLVTSNAQLVSWAEPPQTVFFPKRSIFALTGLILATGLAGALTLLRDRVDRTVRTTAGLQAANMRVLTTIPYVARIDRDPKQLIAHLGYPSSFQEAIRALYAECLLFAPKNGQERLRSVVVTSSDCGEGKTYTTLSFANFAAGAGQRVLLLECDLRQPTMGHALGLPSQVGVTDVLCGQAVPGEVVQHVTETGLDIILAGKPVANSAELVAGPRMKELLAWAREKYDLVVIDTPPSRILADARILASLVDGVIYCARWGQSRTDSVILGMHEIVGAGGRMLGLVLGRVKGTQYQLYEPRNSPIRLTSST